MKSYAELDKRLSDPRVALAVAGEVSRMQNVQKMLDLNDRLALVKRKFDAEQRREAANSGAALPDGSYPIESRKDLSNAIRAIGRANNPARVKAHIKTRAKALGATDAIPEDW